MAISRLIRCGSVHFNLRDITVEPAFFLYMFALQLYLPNTQAFVLSKVCLLEYNSTFCEHISNSSFQKEHPVENDHVQSVTSTWILLTNMAVLVPAMLSGVLFLGSYGDKKGRKLPMLLPTIGFLLHSVGNVVNACYPEAPLPLLLIGPLLNGLCGGVLSMIMGVFSYVTHITSSTSKTIRIGVVESMSLAAGVLGALLSGLMLDKTSFTFVFAFILGLLVLAAVYIMVWIEDLKPAEPVTLPACGTWNYKALKEIWQFVREPRGPKVRLTMLLLVLAMFLLAVCAAGEIDVLLLYVKHEPLAWSQTLFGAFNSMQNLLRGLTLIVALPLLKAKLRVRDTVLMMVGLLSKMVNMVVMGLAFNTALVFIAGILSMAQGLAGVSNRSMMSGLVHRDEQGRLFSLVAVCESISAILASLLFNTVYSKTLNFYAGFSFIMGAIICLIAFIISIYLMVSGASELCSSSPYNDFEGEKTASEAEGGTSSGRDPNDDNDNDEQQCLLHGQQRPLYSVIEPKV